MVVECVRLGRGDVSKKWMVASLQNYFGLPSFPR